MTIKGIQRNCEAAKGKIEELVEVSIKRKAHCQNEVCISVDSIAI